MSPDPLHPSTTSSSSSLHPPVNGSPRPLKRPRKNPAPKEEPAFDSAAGAQPVDHIFIAEGNVAKKPGGKKAPLSCCECRRLKLKCDRNFPCASCKYSNYRNAAVRKYVQKASSSPAKAPASSSPTPNSCTPRSTTCPNASANSKKPSRPITRSSRRSSSASRAPWGYTAGRKTGTRLGTGMRERRRKGARGRWMWTRRVCIST
ncbi:hypothetical protein FPV67DRAFT_745546 [Lyophyllum atratum]|nr:hypothetical protein FPV67DRAFT_745546 [Lyophyllum atratum]